VTQTIVSARNAMRKASTKTVCRIAGTMRMVLFSPLPLEKGTGQSEEFEFRADFFKSSLTFPFPLRKEEATKKKSTCEQFLKIEL